MLLGITLKGLLWTVGIVWSSSPILPPRLVAFISILTGQRALQRSSKYDEAATADGETHLDPAKPWGNSRDDRLVRIRIILLVSYPTSNRAGQVSTTPST